jgi:hypothetical protein
MRKMFVGLMASLVILVGGLSVASPAQAAPGCPNTWFCMHDTSTSNPHVAIDVYDTVLNQCIGGISPITSYVTNRTNYRWIVSTSNDCSANRGVIYPNSEGAMGSTWNNKIRGIFRTSSTSLTNLYIPPAMVGDGKTTGKDGHIVTGVQASYALVG